MEEKETINILLVDDDEEDYLITQDIISDIKNQKYSLKWASNYEKALDDINKEMYDLFLFDYNLGAKTGLDLIDKVNENKANIPVIMLTGQNNYEVDVIAMKKGASNYLIKGKLDADILERSIRYAMEKKKTETQILYMAYYDHMTDLPNMTFFKELLNYALAHASRYKRKTAVMYFDLDNFKVINDSLGHNTGDLLLKEAAFRLCSCVRMNNPIARNNLKTPVDLVAHPGGDEFIISLTEINGYENSSLVANRIIHAFDRPFTIDNHEIFTTASIGIAMYPSDSDDADTLIRYADNAMYYAKRQGKNTFQYYR